MLSSHSRRALQVLPVRARLIRSMRVSGCGLILPVLVTVFLMTLSLNGYATALLSEDLRLHIPWVTVQGRVFSADLALTSVDSTPFFAITNVAERTAQPPDGAAASVNLSDLTLHVPVVSFQGDLFSADLAFSFPGGVPGFALTGASLTALPPGSGTIISVSPLSSKTKEEITFAYFFTGIVASHDVSLFKVTYTTVNAFGLPVPATGLMAIPLNLNAPAPLLSYQHGTMTKKNEAPSAEGSDVVSIVTAASGYVVATPDYLGLGDSAGLHPYVHAKTLAGAVIDMIRAVRTYCAQNGIGLNGQLFLAGYSEGGYATMAAHKEIETHYPDEFIIAASAPAAGPYDLSGAMLKRALSDAPAPNPYYFPYLLLAYNEIYGLADSYSELFAAPYAGSVPGLFDGSHESQDINETLPSLPEEILSSPFMEALETAEHVPFETALRENDVYRWTPRAPMRMYHCIGDQDVPYANSATAHAYFIEQGAPDVTLVTLDFGDHLTCALPTFLLVKKWFDSLADR